MDQDHAPRTDEACHALAIVGRGVHPRRQKREIDARAVEPQRVERSTREVGIAGVKHAVAADLDQPCDMLHATVPLAAVGPAQRVDGELADGHGPPRPRCRRDGAGACGRHAELSQSVREAVADLRGAEERCPRVGGEMARGRQGMEVIAVTMRDEHQLDAIERIARALERGLQRRVGDRVALVRLEERVEEHGAGAIGEQHALVRKEARRHVSRRALPDGGLPRRSPAHLAGRGQHGEGQD